MGVRPLLSPQGATAQVGGFIRVERVASNRQCLHLGMADKPRSSRLVAIFAANVRRRRLALGYSQEQLAARAHVHRTYVGMLERGEKNVTIYNIERIAKALQTKSAELLS